LQVSRVNDPPYGGEDANSQRSERWSSYTKPDDIEQKAREWEVVCFRYAHSAWLPFRSQDKKPACAGYSAFVLPGREKQVKKQCTCKKQEQMLTTQSKGR
jgi:hypothetical protein